MFNKTLFVLDPTVATVLRCFSEYLCISVLIFWSCHANIFTVNIQMLWGQHVCLISPLFSPVTIKQLKKTVPFFVRILFAIISSEGSLKSKVDLCLSSSREWVNFTAHYSCAILSFPTLSLSLGARRSDMN